MDTLGPLVRHVIFMHVIFNSQSLCAPGRPKTPVGRPKWASEYSGEVSTGILPCLIVFVIFPVLLMLVCICTKCSIQWCYRQPLVHRYRSSSNFSSPEHLSRERLRTISGSRHNCPNLRYMSGEMRYSFLPGGRPNNMMVSSILPPDESRLSFVGRTCLRVDDPPPNYPAEEPPPTYESLFDEGKKHDDERSATWLWMPPMDARSWELFHLFRLNLITFRITL